MNILSDHIRFFGKIDNRKARNIEILYIFFFNK